MTAIRDDELPLPEGVKLAPFEGYGPDAEVLEKLNQLPELSVDCLWKLRVATEAERRRWADYKGQIEQEINRRFREAHPNYGPDTGGTVKLPGDAIVLKLGYNRDYEYDVTKLTELVTDELLTHSELAALIPKYEPKVSGTQFNNLLKRGGDVAERLRAARTLKSSSPTLEYEERK